MFAVRTTKPKVSYSCDSRACAFTPDYNNPVNYNQCTDVKLDYITSPHT